MNVNDGAHKKRQSYVYSQRKYDLYAPTVYTHIRDSKITPSHPHYAISTLTFNKLFTSIRYICIDMKKYTGNILLTKEAFEIYARQLREQTAKQHGMTLEQWDAAILNQDVVEAKSSPYVHPYETNNTTGSSTIS